MREIPADVQAAIDRFDEACQSWGWQADQGYIGEDIQKSANERIRSLASLKLAVVNAILSEREQCAEVVDRHAVEWGLAYKTMTDQISSAIRATSRDRHNPKGPSRYAQAKKDEQAK